MDKQAAIKIIRDTFERPFDKGQYIHFVKNLFNRIEIEDKHPYSGQYIPPGFRDYINTLERIARYTDIEDKKIDVLIVKLKKEKSLERARTKQRNFVAWYLNGSRGGMLKDAALVAFVSPTEEDWRFSLVKMEYKLTQTKTGRPKGEEELTPARRYSFLVGKNEPNHTAQQQLAPLLQDDINNPSLDHLESAFNIEKVTKEFFEKYRNLFLEVKERLDEIAKKDKAVQKNFQEKGVDTVDFSKKLLGQIVFLYFLQKKGWLGVPANKTWSEGNKGFLRSLFNKCKEEDKNFFNDYLEVLFYNTLNNPRQDEVDPSYSRIFDCRIPFLNGGLFEPINGYDWEQTDIKIPDELFSNDDKTKEGDTGTGILDVFDRYNFTVKEDEPLEKEVAIDPEMLGKVFENLLEVKDRKSKGTYYTPREIVHYMCQQSLINYLYAELNQGTVSHEKIGDSQLDAFGNKAKTGQLVLTTEHKSYPSISKEEIETLIKYGEQVSENEAVVETKGKETERYYYKLPENIRKNAKIIDEKLANIKVCDPAIGSGAFPVGMMTEIVKTRNALSSYITKPNRTIYNFKRECIEKSLYGVDIDSGAVEIAKLRLWLSLVVDEEDIKKIKPLPNLDYKIICGNSLLGVEKNLENWQLFDQLEKLKPLLFNETSPTKKQEYKKQIDDLISQITKGHKEFDFEVYFSEVFHKKKGFDVVIANPPYVDSERMTKEMPELREIIANKYLTAKGNWDLYIPFWELGMNILSSNGTASFITPNKWLSIKYGEELRKSLNSSIYKIGNCDFIDVFEAGNSPVIIIAVKGQEAKKVLVDVFNKDYSVNETVSIPKNNLSDLNWGWLLSINANILLKLSKCKKGVDYYHCENPFTVSEAYEIKRILKDIKDINKYSPSKHFIFINTGTIEKYYSLWGKEPTKYLGNKFDYPAIDKDIFKEKFPRRFSQTNVPKIIISGIRHFECLIDKKGDIVAGKSTIILKTKILSDTEVILGILNSKLISFYIKEAYGALGINGGINFTSEMIESLPFPVLKDFKTDVRNLRSAVENILQITEHPDFYLSTKKQVKVKEYERQIDQMVYKLYNLTTDEIAIIERGKK